MLWCVYHARTAQGGWTTYGIGWGKRGVLIDSGWSKGCAPLLLDAIDWFAGCWLVTWSGNFDPCRQKPAVRIRPQIADMQRAREAAAVDQK